MHASPCPPFPTSAENLLGPLLAAGLISAESVERAKALLRTAQVHPLSALLRLNAVSEASLYQAYADLLALTLLSADGTDAGELALAVRRACTELGLSPDWLMLKGLLVSEGEQAWQLGVREEVSPDVWALCERRLQHSSKPLTAAVLTPSLFEQVAQNLRMASPTDAVASDDLRLLRELAEEGPTIELVNGMLSEAVTRRASDLHVEPEEHDFAVRLRVDGDMQELARHPKDRFDAVSCRIKILAELDIAERRLPQDGRINARVHGEAFDIRVSVLPGVLGESIVLRLLRQDRKPTRLQDLGMNAEHSALFSRWTQLANGIVLVTGPTGSGKSTTLYTALELANDRSRKIITVEDPVEYRIKGITQLQVNGDIGFSFAAALRSILRHDPDLILVGEIRDEETARIAIQSALTGHLVLSTLHTNSAIGAITRLVDMGLEPFLIAASVRGLMAQRLVRRLCTHCSEPDTSADEALPALLQRFSLTPTGLRRAVGCPQCNGTGFHGRIAIYDLIEIDSDLSHQIATGAIESALLNRIGPQAHAGLLRSGMQLVAEGRTTLAEVLRATAGA